MGTGTSSELAVNMQENTQITFNEITTNSEKISSAGSVSENIDIEVGGNLNCGLMITQTANTSTTSSGKLMSNTASSLNASLKSAMASQVDQAASSAQGFLSTAFGDKVKTKATVTEQINNILDNTITQTNLQNIVASSVDVEKDKIVVKGDWTCPPAGSVLNQDIVSSVTAQALMNQVSSAIDDNAVINNVVNKVKQAASQEDTGPIQEVGKAISDAMGKMILPFLSSGAVACVVCAGGVALLLSPAGQKAATHATNAAVAAAKVASV